MRTSVIVAPKYGVISGRTYRTERARMLVSDRLADGEAYPGETVARLPRRLCRDHDTPTAKVFHRGWPFTLLLMTRSDSKLA